MLRGGTEWQNLGAGSLRSLPATPAEARLPVAAAVAAVALEQPLRASAGTGAEALHSPASGQSYGSPAYVGSVRASSSCSKS
jgi:hypothetical protein